MVNGVMDWSNVTVTSYNAHTLAWKYDRTVFAQNGDDNDDDDAADQWSYACKRNMCYDVRIFRSYPKVMFVSNWIWIWNWLGSNANAALANFLACKFLFSLFGHWDLRSIGQVNRTELMKKEHKRTNADTHTHTKTLKIKQVFEHETQFN